MRICVFASSSSRVNSAYGEAASELGMLLASAGKEVIFGGGGIGLMGILADSVLKHRGKITGVIPSFMNDEGWGHKELSGMIITADMGERKKKMFSISDGVIALPGGVGTLEELAEAITLKQLSLYDGPIIVLNTLNFYGALIEFFGTMVDNHFLRAEHREIWQVVNTPAEALDAIEKWKPGTEQWRKIAKI